MADATVPPTRHDEALVQPEERGPSSLGATATVPRWLLLAIWATFAVLGVAFLTVGSLRIGAGNWIGRRMTVSQIWGRFLDFLADQGASPLAIAVTVGAAVLALVGSLVLILVAVDLQDDRPLPASDPPGK